MDLADGWRREFRDAAVGNRLTYEAAPPLPERFVAANDAVLMTVAEIETGRGGSSGPTCE